MIAESSRVLCASSAGSQEDSPMLTAEGGTVCSPDRCEISGALPSIAIQGELLMSTYMPEIDLHAHDDIGECVAS